MNKRLQRLLRPGFHVYFLMLLFFAVLSVAFGQPVLASLQGAAIVIFYLYYRLREMARQREVLSHIETLANHVDNAASDSLVSFPLPMLIVNLDGDEIVWANSQFNDISGVPDRPFSNHLSNITQDFDLKWILKGKTECPSDVLLNDRYYHVYGSVIRPFKGSQATTQNASLLAVLYWIDTTDVHHLKQALTDTRPAFGILMVDNYEEMVKDISEGEKSSLRAAIDERVSRSFEGTGAYLRRYDRDKYLFVIDNAALQQLIVGKFAVLNTMRELTTPDGVPITLSIGIGIHDNHFAEASSYASLAIDMAQARGGDQAVIKDALNFNFYGGHSKEMEKRTKVKSRIVANTLKELIIESDQVLIMGHKESDIDSVGAAAGIAFIAQSLDIPVYIVIDQNNTAAQPLIDRLKAQPTFENVFITPDDGMIRATAQTLLIIVDTSRIDYVESPALLQALNNVAVIDHHRRAADYIERTALSFHEPYASSTCELVTELMQYLIEPKALTRAVAEALLGGIALDSKFFSMHTGVRTFEAATYLRSAGADMTSVKKMFQTDLSDSMLRYEIIRKASVVRDYIAIVTQEKPVPVAIAAQAADELLDIRTIRASFVLSPHNGGVNINARSLDQINVQVICEKLGGGGHMTIAGAQMQNIDVFSAAQKLLTAIDEYFEEAGEPQ